MKKILLTSAILITAIITAQASQNKSHLLSHMEIKNNSGKDQYIKIEPREPEQYNVCKSANIYVDGTKYAIGEAIEIDNNKSAGFLVNISNDCTPFYTVKVLNPNPLSPDTGIFKVGGTIVQGFNFIDPLNAYAASCHYSTWIKYGLADDNEVTARLTILNANESNCQI